jgi:hypothetical protein
MSENYQSFQDDQNICLATRFMGNYSVPVYEDTAMKIFIMVFGYDIMQPIL